MSYYRFPEYVSVGEKREKAERKIRQLKKKNPGIDPIIIEGRAIAHTWWGKAWNRNLERYADYSNRIGRGRSYVRHRAVLDLKIEPGTVHALVQGSASRPYEVEIDIKALPAKTWKRLIDDCRGKLNSLQDLLEGRFPKALSHLFMEESSGLFPTPKEIGFSCSCPDWASMCKHVAATLYGIGARLDRDPALFFELRQVNLDDLIGKALADATGSLFEKAKQNNEGIIADADLGDLFGIDMDEMPDLNKTVSSTSPKKSKKRKGKKPAKSLKKAAPRRQNTPKRDDKTRIMAIVEQATDGIGASELSEKSGVSIVKIRNILYQACSNGEIRKIARGVFAGNPPKKSLTPAQREAAILSVVGSADQGVRAPEISQATGIPIAAVRPVLPRLLKNGAIRRISRGLYGPQPKSRNQRGKKR